MLAHWRLARVCGLSRMLSAATVSAGHLSSAAHMGGTVSGLQPEMNDVINERRKSPRFALTVAAAVSEPFDPSEMIGRLADISRTGCYIDTVHPLAPGMHVKIRLRVEDELFETLAKVIHVHPKRGMGLNWGTNPQEQNLEVLNRWLHPTSQAVGRETLLK